MDKHPNAIIFTTGSSTSKTRLYPMGIAKFIEEAFTDFEMYSEYNNEWLSFIKA
jgi:hypothetical protein